MQIYAACTNNHPVLFVQCAEEQRHVSESLYPFTYNPKMSLNLSQVPTSSQRSPPLTRTQLRDINESKEDKVGVRIKTIKQFGPLEACSVKSLYVVLIICFPFNNLFDCVSQSDAEEATTARRVSDGSIDRDQMNDTAGGC